MNQTTTESNFLVELAAHKINFDGVALPLALGQGITLRYTDEDETKAIFEYLGFPRRTELKVNDSYICFEKDDEFKDEKEYPLRIRRAFVLLPSEILFRSEVIELRIKSGELRVGFRVRRAEDCGARILEASNYLISKEVNFTQATLKRVKALASYDLASDPFISSYVSAHNSIPNSVFRIVTYMSIVEGLIGTKKEIGNIRDNISTKMSFFFKYIWPDLDLAENLSGPKYRDGREVLDVRGAWNDLYRLRNLIVHGGGNNLDNGIKLKDCTDGISALRDVTWQEAFEILDYGMKALIYWNLEDSEARECFAQIV